MLSHLLASQAPLLEMLKGVCFNLLVILTVLVIASNEVRRLKLPVPWIEERQEDLRRAWLLSAGLYVMVAAIYAYVVGRPVLLLVDVVTAGLLVGGVHYLEIKRGGGLTRRDEDDDYLDPQVRGQAAHHDPAEPDDDSDEPATRRPQRRERSRRRPRDRR